jgi:phenylpropionate dioxygenase-like ring-hydroxylating dioxygenase large terminal subunit
MNKKACDFISQSNVKDIRSNLENALSLPPVCYTADEFYSIEEEHVFRKNWMCVGRSSQISNVGDYFTIDLLNDPLVIVRDEKNNVRALSRVCKHRWMQIVEGKGNSKNFKCPYHGWIYDLTGKLRASPGMDKSHFDKDECTLPSLRTEIWQGFIFVNYDVNAKSLTSLLSGLNKKLDGYQISEMKSIEPIVYESEWNWKVMVENASEVYHLGLHSNTLVSSLPVRSSIIEDNDGPYTYYRIPNKNREALPTSFQPVDTLNTEQLSEFVLCTVFPCHIMIINPDQITWLQILPKTATSHTLRFLLCFNPSSFNEKAFYQKCKQSKWFLQEIHEEDIFACQSVQKGLFSEYAKPASFSYLEKSIWQFHNWILDQLDLG